VSIYLRNATDGKVSSPAFTKIAESEQFRQFQEDTSELQLVNLEQLSEKEKLAFFMDIYNLLTLHAHVELQPNDISMVFFQSTAYEINNVVFSLATIEHSILRAEMVNPDNSKRFTGISRKKKIERVAYQDYRLAFIEPLLNFALNCGAISCPKIQIYTQGNVQELLNISTREYLRSTVQIDRKKRIVLLPEVFKWYLGDFGSTWDQVFRFVSRYLDESSGNDLLALINEAESDKINIKFREFNWDIQYNFF